MISQTLVLVSGKMRFRVSLKNYAIVNETDIASLLNKTATDVWRWARYHKCKVYFEDFLPV